MLCFYLLYSLLQLMKYWFVFITDNSSGIRAEEVFAHLVLSEFNFV